jgi:precorrin-2 dehydrogenase/sirohydrochlorin ferrochelatase
MAVYYPAFLDLRGRRCLVVGGGAVAERKVGALLDAGARVVIVSPTLTTSLGALAAERDLEHRARRFRRHDTRGCALVVAATGVVTVDDAVVAAARRAHALVNVVDRRAACDFILPSVLRRGDLQIAVSTGGKSPALAREIRRRLEAEIGDDYGELVARVGRVRARLRGRPLAPAARMRAADRLAVTALTAHLRQQQPSAAQK